MSDAVTVTTRYWGTLIQNPVFSDIIQGLMDAGLYTSYLSDPNSPALTGDGSILSYANGNGNEKSAVALDVIVDVISRSILKNLKNGFDGTANTAANINFTTVVPNLSVNINSCTNVSEALVLLANEIAAIKVTLQTVTQGSFQSAALIPVSPSTAIELINIK